MPVAEFNRGLLRYGWDDPRSSGFVSGLDRVNRIAERSEGFIWRCPNEWMERAQRDPKGPLGGDPRLACTLSVWRDVETLEAFVFETVHRVFFERREEWFDPGQGLRMVLWDVADGHRPSVQEAVERFDRLVDEGASDHAYDWAYSKTRTA